MSQEKNIIVIGAGIVGVSAAIWLQRKGIAVTLVDKNPPGEGTSYGNAGVLAACSVAPVTAPGLISKGPKLLLNPDYPLFLRWPYLPKLATWLYRYLSHANDSDTHRIAAGLKPLTIENWLGHRPAPADCLPLIGEIRKTGVITAFGHHHIGLTSGPKTGRLVADLLSPHGGTSLDLTAYSPIRFT